MSTVKAFGTPRLPELTNISWINARQRERLRRSMTVETVEKHATIFDEKQPPDSAYILLEGVARVTCRNRKGTRALVTMVAPGLIPVFPPPVPGISYNFRCEAVTLCRIGTIELEALVEICVGITSRDFRRMASSYLGRWDLVQLRCANFMSCTLDERLALILLELAENFGVSDPKGTRLALPARHRDLAELVGASRPRITECLIEFQRRKLISRNRRQIVINRDGLETFLSQTHELAA